MFVAQPEIPVPLAVEFPFPAWATRLSECASPPAGNSAASSQPIKRSGNVFSRLPLTQPDDDPIPF
jgi:hypothetical protein